MFVVEKHGLETYKALRRVARKQTKHVRTAGRMLDGGDPEGVHRARVALRRLRTLVGLARPWIGKKEAKKLVEPLRELGSLLGDIRDQDVHCELAVRLRVQGASGRRESWLAHRPAAVRKASRRLSSMNWKSWFEDFEVAVRSLGIPVSVAVLAMLKEPVCDAEGLLLGPLDEKSLHRLRIVAKRLRYTLEFFGLHCLTTPDRPSGCSQKYRTQSATGATVRWSDERPVYGRCRTDDS